MLLSGISCNIPQVSCIFQVYMQAFKKVCIPRKCKWQVGHCMVYHKRALHNYFTRGHRKYSGPHNQCDIDTVHDGKVGCNTVEYTTAFLYLDWLYFLWHGIKLFQLSILVICLHSVQIIDQHFSSVHFMLFEYYCLVLNSTKLSEQRVMPIQLYFSDLKIEDANHMPPQLQLLSPFPRHTLKTRTQYLEEQLHQYQIWLQQWKSTRGKKGISPWQVCFHTWAGFLKKNS